MFVACILRLSLLLRPQHSSVVFTSNSFAFACLHVYIPIHSISRDIYIYINHIHYSVLGTIMMDSAWQIQVSKVSLLSSALMSPFVIQITYITSCVDRKMSPCESIIIYSPIIIHYINKLCHKLWYQIFSFLFSYTK